MTTKAARKINKRKTPRRDNAQMMIQGVEETIKHCQSMATALTIKRLGGH
jgi:hypothetical protein